MNSGRWFTGVTTLAMQSLKKARIEAIEDWNDQSSRDFEETYLEPLEPKLRRAMDAIGRLDTLLTKAERDVSSY